MEATVNFATEKAHVAYTNSVDPQVLIATIEATGYTAAAPPTADNVDGPAEPPCSPARPNHCAAGC